MQRYMYIIEVQKPTGAYRFLKALETPLRAEGKIINSTHDFEMVLFDDRTESYSYICTLDVDTWTDLLDAYYHMVRQHKLSLQYNYDGWVYLIPKRGKHHIGPPIAHPPIVRPTIYKDPDPIKFYPISDDQEGQDTPIPFPDEDDLPPVPSQKTFFAAQWYERYLHRLQELYNIHRCCHSMSYTEFEAFVLTYGEYYKTLDKMRPRTFNRFLLKETWRKPSELPVVLFAATETCDNNATYAIYVKPTFEGEATTVGVNGEFYTTLDQAEILPMYVEFAAQVALYRKHSANADSAPSY